MKQNTNLALALRALAKQGWFSQRSLHTRAILSSIAKLRTFAKDELVYLAGDPPSGVFGLVTGSLQHLVSTGRRRRLHRPSRRLRISGSAMSLFSLKGAASFQSAPPSQQRSFSFLCAIWGDVIREERSALC